MEYKKKYLKYKLKYLQAKQKFKGGTIPELEPRISWVIDPRFVAKAAEAEKLLEEERKEQREVEPEAGVLERLLYYLKGIVVGEDAAEAEAKKLPEEGPLERLLYYLKGIVVGEETVAKREAREREAKAAADIMKAAVKGHDVRKEVGIERRAEEKAAVPDYFDKAAAASEKGDTKAFNKIIATYNKAKKEAAAEESEINWYKVAFDKEAAAGEESAEEGPPEEGELGMEELGMEELGMEELGMEELGMEGQPAMEGPPGAQLEKILEEEEEKYDELDAARDREKKRIEEMEKSGEKRTAIVVSDLADYKTILVEDKDKIFTSIAKNFNRKATDIENVYLFEEDNTKKHISDMNTETTFQDRENIKEVGSLYVEFKD